MVRRFPGLDGCGTRVHTIPEAFATSIAATRSKTRSYSWSSISCGYSITGPSSSHRHQGTHADARGPRSGTEILTGVLEATMRDPKVKAPAPDLHAGSRPKEVPASAGNHPDPARRAPPAPENPVTAPPQPQPAPAGR